MKISEKINLDKDGLIKYGPINIVAFGDSITHGMFEPGEIDYEAVYWNRLKKKIYDVKMYVPVNVIDAGIGGITAEDSVERVDSQVLIHQPDAVIICFGLNDVTGSVGRFTESLRNIFEKCRAVCSEVIYMTPNMLNTYVAEDTHEADREYAAITAKMQNDGVMDMFMQKACECAKDCDVQVCDVYSKWKEMSKTQDTTMMLTNRVNHPKRELHELFAQSLFDILFAR